VNTVLNSWLDASRPMGALLVRRPLPTGVGPGRSECFAYMRGERLPIVAVTRCVARVPEPQRAQSSRTPSSL